MGFGVWVSGLELSVEKLFTVCGRTVEAYPISGVAGTPVYVSDVEFRV